MEADTYSIKTRIENATPEEKYNMVTEFYDKWIISTDECRNRNPIEILKLCINKFKLDDTNFQLGQFKKAKDTELFKMVCLKVYIEQSDMQKYEVEKKEIINKCNKILNVVVDSENTILNLFRLTNSMIEDDIGKTDDLVDINRFTPIEAENNTPYQNLLLFLLERLLRSGYRRYNGECYAKQYTPDGYDTHFWRRMTDLKKFIYSSINKDIHADMWHNLTACKDNAKGAITYLTDCMDIEFEDIVKDRHVFSFNNGIYITCNENENGIYEDEWIPYDGPNSKKIGSSIVACNYIETNFDESTRANYNDDTYIYNDWFNIIIDKCKLFKSIMDYQEWDTEIQRWLCILIGRCLYDTGELDGWQIVPFLLGQAGTGKSTIINSVVKQIYDHPDIGTLSNNIEHKFGLSPLFNKFVVVAPEVKANFGLEQSEFQSMISGESMSIAIKNKEATSIERWKVPLIMAGNEVPQYSDNAGSISRRVIVFMFSKKIKRGDGDTMLGNKIKAEIGDIIHACNRAYIETINKHESTDIWNIVPDYFRDTRDDMAETTNALVGFLKSERVILGKDFSVSETIFVEAFNDYCKELNYGKQKWTHHYCMGPFENVGIVVERNDKIKGRGTRKKSTGTQFFNVKILPKEEKFEE